MMRALPLHPTLATEPTEPTEVPTHSPYCCCSHFPTPLSGDHPQQSSINQMSLEWRGEPNKKKVVRGSVDSVGSVAIQPRYELREGIGNAIKVIG